MIEFQWWQAIVLGAVQGFTEFLPVSSSGHLALAHVALGLRKLPLSFDILTHLGTLVAVFIFFWPKIIKTNLKYWFQIGVATIPAVIVGLLGKDAIEATTYSRVGLTAGFLMSALFLFIAQKFLEQEKTDQAKHPMFTFMNRSFTWLREVSKSKEKSPSTLKSLMIGVMQALALLPSVSRSGTTLLGALMAGLPREEAFTFIFLMSIPAILGANILDFVDVWQSGEFAQIPWGPYILGVVVAGITGFMSLRFFRVLIVRAKLTTFAWYLVFVAFLSFFLV
jgi:undecaprenyl-diphosphatase